MKKYFNKYILFAVTGVLALSSCTDAENPVDEVIDGTTRGAALRTVDLISNELPIGIAEAGFAADFEIQDIEQGTLVDNVNVYIGFNDNTVAAGAPDLDVPESLFTTIGSDTFSQGPFGLPRISFEVSLTEMLTHVGVIETDLFGGDNFPIRFELVLNDGRTFSSTNSNPGNLGGSFFNSPFIYFPTVVCFVGEDQFVGEYNITTAPASPVGGVPTWEDQTVTLAIGSTSTQRTFEAIYLEGLGIGNGPNEFAFDLVCGDVFVPAGQGSGLQCVAGITFGPSDDGRGTYEVDETFIPTDDSAFTIVFAEDEANDCGAGTPTITATLTKL